MAFTAIRLLLLSLVVVQGHFPFDWLPHFHDSKLPHGSSSKDEFLISHSKDLSIQSPCALVLNRARPPFSVDPILIPYKPDEGSNVPNGYLNYDLVSQPSLHHDVYKSGYGYVPFHYRYKRFTSGQRVKRSHQNSAKICITYADVDAAYHKASTQADCRKSQEVPGSESTKKDITRSADCTDLIGKILADMFEMAPHEIINALPLIDTSRTQVYDVCTGNIKPRPCTAEKFSDISGTCNNLNNPTWGANRTPTKRILPAVYADGFSKLRKSVVRNEELPLPRKISSALHNDKDSSRLPVCQIFMEIGQVLAHDLILSAPTLNNSLDFACCGVEKSKQHKNCLTIEIPAEDPFHGPAGRRCMEFKRTLSGQRENCRLGPREQINDLTHGIDLNWVYGSSTSKSNLLRTFKNGQMTTYLPESFKERGLKPLLPSRTKIPDMGCIRNKNTPGKFCREAGDPRVNENVFMVALQTIFLRDHNRAASMLQRLNPHWDDDRLYLEARRICIAKFQHIVYNEYIPQALGRDLTKKWDMDLSPGFWNGYDDKVNLAVSTSFGVASFRFSHSNIDSKVDRYNKNHKKIGSHNLRESFRKPFMIEKAGIVDEFLLGLVDQQVQDTDTFMSKEVTNHLFQKNGKTFGIDLAATNIKRGRDHGIPSYNSYRKLCGLPELRSFYDLNPIFQNSTAQIFSRIYKHVDDIDLWSGGIAEINLPNAMVGPTFGCLIGMQFNELRKGDRFWYENPGWPSSFTLQQIKEIKKATVAKMICNNGDDIETIQVNTMQLADNISNLRLKCEDIPDIDLSLWKEYSNENIYFRFVK